MADSPVDFEHDPLEACANEPIQTPGTIMPHGMLLSVARPGQSVGWRLMRASANAGPVLSCPVEEAVGRPLDNVLAPAFADLAGEISQGLGVGTVDLPRRTIHGVGYDVLAHRSGDEVVVEFEQIPPNAPASANALYGEVRALVETFQRLPGVDQMSRTAAEVVRRIT